MKLQKIDYIFLSKKTLHAVFTPFVVFVLYFLSSIFSTSFVSHTDIMFFIFLLYIIIAIVVKYIQFRDVQIFIIVFLLGILIEIVKVNTSQWYYQDIGRIVLEGVPLFAGFLYVAVADFILHLVRYFNIKILTLEMYEHKRVLLLMVFVILNLLINWYLPDFRIVIFIFMILLLWNVKISININEKIFYIPILLKFFIFSLIIWIAENIVTYYKGYSYLRQISKWKIVDYHIIFSWYMLIMVIFFIVYWFYRINQEIDYANMINRK